MDVETEALLKKILPLLELKDKHCFSQDCYMDILKHYSTMMSAAGISNDKWPQTFGAVLALLKKTGECPLSL